MSSRLLLRRTVDQPVVKAIRADDVDQLQALVAAGADLGARDDSKISCLHEAAGWNAVRVIGYLVLEKHHSMKAKARFGDMPLMHAAMPGNTAALELLLDLGAEADAAGMGGETALMAAAQQYNLPAVKALLERGADPNLTCRNGSTALHSVCYAQFNPPLTARVIAALLDAGANAEIVNDQGRTALEAARTFHGATARTAIETAFLRGHADLFHSMSPGL